MFADILEPYTINIFTDASLRKVSLNPEEIWVCSGVIIVNGKNIIAEDYRVYKNETSNYAEIKAVKLGISMAYNICMQNKNITRINLFSDSLFSIYGIREWIFNWRVKSNQLIGYKNKPISNQDVFLEIVNLIVNGNIPINLYHQKGHSDECSFKKSIDTFIEKNWMVGASLETIDIEFIKYINLYNQFVDNSSRKILYEIPNAREIITPISFPILDNHNDLINKYAKLINSRR